MTPHQVFPRPLLSSIPFALEWIGLSSQCPPILGWVSHEHWYCRNKLAFFAHLSASLSLSWLVFRFLGSCRLPVVGRRVVVPPPFMGLWTGLLPKPCDGILRTARNPKPPLAVLWRRRLADLTAASTLPLALLLWGYVGMCFISQSLINFWNSAATSWGPLSLTNWQGLPSLLKLAFSFLITPPASVLCSLFSSQ